MSAANPLPDPTPRLQWRLPTSAGHELQVQEWGAPDGLPVLLLHGGPGSSCNPALLRPFDLQRQHVIGFDQRGAGRSTPAGGTAHNSVPDLLADIHLLRRTLGIARWLVVGGSWGATLALLHALDAPDAVSGVLLRGVFLAREVDLDAFFDPAAWISWQPAQGRLMDGLDAVMQHGDRAAQDALSVHWWRWEMAMDGMAIDTPPAPATLHARYRVQAHYLRHGCWLTETPLLERLAAAPLQVPVQLLHGTEDRICPPAGAAAVQRRIPGARLRWVAGAGHAPTHPAMHAALVEALATWNGSAFGVAD